MILKIGKALNLGADKIGKLTADKFNELLDYQLPVTLVDASTVTWNLRKGYNAKVTLAGNRTLVLSQLIRGDYGTLEIVQDAVGGRTLTLPSGSKVVNSGAGVLTLSAAANAIDIATFYYNGTTIYWTISNSFS